MITGDFDKGSLGHIPALEDEPDGQAQDIADVLADAEAIVNDAAPSVVADLDKSTRARQPWWRRKKRGGDDGDDFRLSNR